MEVCLKKLCFIHLILLEDHLHCDSNIIEILTSEIQEALNSTQRFLIQPIKEEESPKSVSTGLKKIFSSYFEKLSVKSISIDTKASPSLFPDHLSSEIVPDTASDLSKSQPCNYIKEDDQESYRSALCKKIILPYCSFLLKLVVHLTTIKIEGRHLV